MQQLLRSQACAPSAAGPRRADGTGGRRGLPARGLKENVAALPPTDNVAVVRIPELGWEVKNVEGKK
jgi:hypothetical protein